MEKHELLKSIGFSDNFLKHLDDFDKQMIYGDQFVLDNNISFTCEDFSNFENIEDSGSELFIHS